MQHDTWVNDVIIDYYLSYLREKKLNKEDASNVHICSTMFYKSMLTRAGPPSQKWSDQQITVNPTGSLHKKARGKKFDPKKVDFD